MAFWPKQEKARLRGLGAPPYSEALPLVTRWMARKGLSAQMLADRLSSGRSTMNMWLQGRYDDPVFSTKPRSAALLTARIWEYVQNDPIEKLPPPPERLLETRNGAEIRRLFNACLKRRNGGILYGAPAKEKTFILECLVSERQQTGEEDIFFFRCPVDPSPVKLALELCRLVGIRARSYRGQILLHELISDFRSRERLPLVIVDEAQRLLRRPYDALEWLRDLRDLTGNQLAAEREDSYGCGLLLTGSHDLHREFKRNAHILGQWNSRIQKKIQLSGMSEEEVLEVAAQELRPARLNDVLRKELLQESRDIDTFALNEKDDPAPHEFYSPRRLAVAIDSLRDKLARRKEHAA